MGVERAVEIIMVKTKIIKIIISNIISFWLIGMIILLMNPEKYLIYFYLFFFIYILKKIISFKFWPNIYILKIIY